jgi:ankyrin repeat protein
LLKERSTLLVGDLQTALTAGDENDAARVAHSEQPVSLASGPSASYRTPLQIAAEEGRVEIVNFLLRIDQGRESDVSDGVLRALELAAAAGHVEVVKSLSSSQLISADFHSGRPLEAAAENSHKEVVACLLQLTQNLPGTKSSTPAIQLAAAKGHHEIVELLVSSGFDPNHTSVDRLTNIQMLTPVQVAAQHDFETVLAVLFRHGADLESDGDGLGYTPLLEAASNGHASAMRYLISIRASPTRVGRYDPTRTPLLAAAENNHMDVVELLADTATVEDLRCSTVEAAAHGNADIVKWLLSRSLINSTGSSQALHNAALMKASENGALETV